MFIKRDEIRVINVLYATTAIALYISGRSTEKADLQAYSQITDG